MVRILPEGFRVAAAGPALEHAACDDFLCGPLYRLGVWPQPLYAMLPFAVDFVPYTASHVVFYLQLPLFSGLAFF